MEKFSINKKEGLKRKSLTLGQRLKILERLEAGEQSAQLAEEFKVAKSTISRIKNGKDEIFKNKTTIETCGGKLDKKRFRGVEDTVLEKTLFNWYCKQKDIGELINGPALQKKALYFNKQLGGSESFKASPGWLRLFKKRHGIKFSSVSDETDDQTSEEFQKKITNLLNISGINLDSLYSCNVTKLFWKTLTDKSETSPNEKCVTNKRKSKDKVSVMICTNASGTHKIPLYVIGQPKISHCSEGFKKLPVIYENQHNLQVDKTLMMKWYNDIFIPEVNKKHNYNNKENLNTILLIKNICSELAEEDFNTITDLCTVMFVPRNVISKQLMDRGIVEEFNKNYQAMLMKRIFVEKAAEECDKVIDSFDILDGCTYSAFAWNNITEDTIKNHWKKFISLKNNQKPSDTVESVDANNIHYLLSHIPELSTSVNTIDELVDGNSSKSVEQSSEDNFHRPSSDANKENFITENSDDVAQKPNNDEDNILSISPGEAYKGLSTFINWFRTCDDDDLPSTINLMTLEEYRQYVISKIISSI